MGCKKDRLSPTGFFVLFWGSLLSGVIESYISLSTEIGGSGGFLSPLLALPVVLLLGVMIKQLVETEGVAGLFSPYGNIFGKILLFITFCWGILLISIRLRLCANRFLAVGYQEGSLYFLLPTVALFVLWMAGSSLSGFARSATLFFWGLLAVLLLVIMLSFPEVEGTRIFPLWVEDIPSIIWGTIPVFGVFGYGIFASFFLCEVEWGRQSPWIVWSRWCTLGCLCLATLTFITVGTFGVTLTGEMDQPFFQLAKGIRIQGAFQRVESVIAALWTLADFILLGVLLRGTAQCGKLCTKCQQSSLLLLVLVCISTVIAFFCGKLQYTGEWIELWGNILFGVAIPTLGFLLKQLRKKT